MTRIDVVIATYNRPKPLRRCLLALAQQKVHPSRIIVVDDCSEHPAETIAFQAAHPVPVSFYRTDRNSGPARARNLAVSKSDADVVLFIDDDVVADANLVALHVAAHAKNPRCAVIGPLVAPGDWHPTPWNRWEAMTLAEQYESMARGDWEVCWRQFYTGNASVRRLDFLELGGFDERFTRAEDIEFGLRAALKGLSFQFEPGAIGWHYAERSRESWMRMAADYARFDRVLSESHPELGWLEVMEQEQRRRHWLVRTICSIAAFTRMESLAARGAVSAGAAAARIGAVSASLGLLTVGFTIEYRRALGRRQPSQTLAIASES